MRMRRTGGTIISGGISRFGQALSLCRMHVALRLPFEHRQARRDLSGAQFGAAQIHQDAAR